MDFNKMKHVLAARTRAANKERAESRSLKAQKEQQNVSYLNRKRQETAIRRQKQNSAANANHLGSKLALYSKAVTEANMRKSADRMTRVNRYPNPNPGGLQVAERVGGAVGGGSSRLAKAGKSSLGVQPEQDDDVAMDGAVPRAEPNIWGKIAAFDKHVADEKEKEKRQAEKAATVTLAAQLAEQVRVKEAQQRKLAADDAKYAQSEARQRAAWKVEEAAQSVERMRFEAAEKKMFADAKALVDTRRAEERRADAEQELREVARIKRGQRAAEKRVLREKARAKATLDRFKREREADDKLQLVVQAQRKTAEIESSKDAMRMMDKMDAERQAKIDEQLSHQAYLYGKGESTQDRIAKQLKIDEARMLEQYERNNRAEDAKAKARVDKAQRLAEEQKASIAAQLARQAAARREEAEAEFRLAHQAKIVDEESAFEMMLKEVAKRQTRLDFKEKLLEQRTEERLRKRAEKKTITPLELRLNAKRIKAAEDFWAAKCAAEEKNPPPPLPACLGVADLGMR